MRALVPVGVLALCASACEIQQVVVAEPEPFVVAEAFLTAAPDSEHAREPVLVALHASAGGETLIDATATITLSGADRTVGLRRVDALRCLAFGHSIDPRQFPGGLACYSLPASADDGTADFPIVSGELYRISIELPDGSRLDGATRVPDAVAFGNESEFCYLPEWTQAQLEWSRAEGTAAYILDLSAIGLGDALAREGIVVDVSDPFLLRGLAIGDSDTTVVLPAEFGLFDRFSLDSELSLALQRGVPEGVYVEIVLAAVDANFVDWVRGGDFNPSGLVRTPSLFGDGGTGVIASASTDMLRISTHDEDAIVTPCGAPPTS